MHWLLTSTTYGTWLPGDRRGSVTSVRDRRSSDALSAFRFEHDQVGQPYEAHLEGLERSARQSLKSPPVHLTVDQAEIVWRQFVETCQFRRWELTAASIMHNHFHAVVAAQEGVSPRKLLADLKAYASRELNRCFGRPAGGWWTDKGSKRPLANELAVDGAVNYLLYKQPDPMVVWSVGLGRIK